MADHPSPVAAELSEARDLCALPDAEQLELIRDVVPGRDAGTAVALAERRGRGRPPGALNRRNAKFRDQLLAMSHGMHPALVLARAYTTPVEQLAATLQCSRAEAFGFQLRAATEVLPYMEGKQPVQVELHRRSDVVLIMPGGGLSGDVIDALAIEASEAMEEGIDWSTAEPSDVLPSLSGVAQPDVPPPPVE
jgi:hypothetical protein